MDAFIRGTLDQPLSGIEARHWLSFFRAFQDRREEAAIGKALDRLAKDAAAYAGDPGAPVDRALAVVAALRSLLGLDPDRGGDA